MLIYSLESSNCVVFPTRIFFSYTGTLHRNKNCTANVNLWHAELRQEQSSLIMWSRVLERWSFALGLFNWINLFSRHLVRANCSISIMWRPGRSWTWNYFAGSEKFLTWVKAQECCSPAAALPQSSQPGSALTSPFSEPPICFFRFVGFFFNPFPSSRFLAPGSLYLGGTMAFS